MGMVWYMYFKVEKERHINYILSRLSLVIEAKLKRRGYFFKLKIPAKAVEETGNQCSYA